MLLELSKINPFRVFENCDSTQIVWGFNCFKCFTQTGFVQGDYKWWGDREATLIRSKSLKCLNISSRG